MNRDGLHERVTELLHQGGTTALTASEIGKALALRGKAVKKLQKDLNQLVFNGDIVRIRGNRYALGKEADLVTGSLIATRAGHGIIRDSTVGDVFIRSDDVGTALPGDRVVVRLGAAGDAKRAGERPGRVIRILDRARTDIVGTLRRTERFLYVVPIDPTYQHDFYVPSDGGGKVGDRVVVRFVEWRSRHVNPEGEIVEVLGPSGAPSVDTLSVIRHHGLREGFPDEVMREAEAAAERVRRPGPRLDCRDRLVITIDPARAKDFDDALSLETADNGNRVLGVHIADVSHFVRPGSQLDREAGERGNSVYLPDKVLPMLPEALSNGVCSLRPDEDRLAFSAFLEFAPDGAVVRRRFARTKIRSARRLTYEQAMAVLAARGKRKPPAQPGEPLSREETRLLRDLGALAQTLRKRRMAQHAVDIDMPECEVVLDEKGEPADFVLVRNDPSHQLVEECMLAANEAVALELHDRGVPLVSRLHEPPDPEKLEELSAQLTGLGFSPGDLSKPRNMSRFLKSVGDHPLAHHVSLSVLRSMSRAVYSAVRSGHFGLAKAHYCHFTSPIRRYPDLVVHRQLAATLAAPAGKGETRAKPRQKYRKDELTRLADACSRTEQAAEEAERALLEIMKYRFLARQIETGKPVVYDAVVTRVTNFGMFVEVLALQLQGLVHVSSIPGRFARFHRQAGTLNAGNQTYGLGRRVKVLPASVDMDGRRVDFTLAVPEQEQPPSGRRQVRA